MKFECQCCGDKTSDESAIGPFDICELCGWEADSVRSKQPDYEGGANGISLREARYKFYRLSTETTGFEKSANLAAT